MRKEVLFAIIAGVSIGIVVAFGTWKISKTFKKPLNTEVRKETPKPKNNNGSPQVNIKDYDIFSGIPSINGQVTPNSDVIISTIESDYYVRSDIDGAFSAELKIPTGISEIVISNPDMPGSEKKYQVIFTEESTEGLIAYVGTITDISTGTIQIKGDKGEIKQASVNDVTKYINSLKKNITVKQTDLAIGDYVIAMGKSTGNKVLETSTIVIASPSIKNDYSAKKIIIEKISRNAINDIKLPTKWNGPNVKELEEGETIILVGSSTNENYSLRSIFKHID